MNVVLVINSVKKHNVLYVQTHTTCVFNACMHFEIIIILNQIHISLCVCMYEEIDRYRCISLEKI